MKFVGCTKLPRIAKGWYASLAMQVMGSGAVLTIAGTATPSKPVHPAAGAFTLGRSTLATEVLMPKLSFSMTEGTIAEWHAASGADVKEGEVLYTIDADKSAQEVEAPASGTLNILIKPGETVEVGTVLATIS